jgi:hypothetical protein
VVDECLRWLVKVGKVELGAEFLPVLGFMVDRKEGRVNIIKGRSRVLFAKNTTSVNAMCENA